MCVGHGRSAMVNETDQIKLAAISKHTLIYTPLILGYINKLLCGIMVLAVIFLFMTRRSGKEFLQ